MWEIFQHSRRHPMKFPAILITLLPVAWLPAAQPPAEFVAAAESRRQAIPLGGNFKPAP
jgi:hypothetical protein